MAETGLYADPDHRIVADDVYAYRPRFELWSDGAEKRRWLKLPEGTTIDVSDMDAWRFPVGTKVWKQFGREGVLLETRLLHKRGPGLTGWDMVAFAWNPSQTQAVATPEGATNVLDTSHDIPNEQQCLECHAGQPDVLLGVSAIQLARPDDRSAPTLNLARLAADGWLSEEVADTGYPLPGDANTHRALGALHANCGHCHNPTGMASKTDLDLWLRTEGLETLEMTSTYRSTVGVEVEIETEELSAALLVAPGRPEQSAIYERMTRRGDDVAMPPIATEEVDSAASDAVGIWIESLPTEPCTEDPCDAGT